MSRSGRSYSSSSGSSTSSNSAGGEDIPAGRASSTTAPAPAVTNVFKNDGSFLDMFKKMQEAKDKKLTSKTDTVISPPSTSAVAVAPSLVPAVTLVEEQPKPKALPMVGKRRGGKALPTGMVKKAKKGPMGEDDEDAEPPKDAWSQYMAEVKRYKETSCEEEGKTRPLVK